MAKVITNADKLEKNLHKVKEQSVKMYSELAQNIFDQLAIDSTSNIRILGGRLTGRALLRSIKTTPAIKGRLTSRTGRLVSSLNNKNFRGKNEAIREVKADGRNVVLTYGTSVIYAAIHEPTRPFLNPAVKELPKKMQKLFDMAWNSTLGKLFK